MSNVGSPANAATAPGTTLPGSIPASVYSPDGPYYDRDNGFGNVTVYDITAQIDWRLPFATFTVIPSYLHTSEKDVLYTPNGSSQASTASQTSLEARLASRGGNRLQWVVGGFTGEGGLKHAPVF